MTVPSLGDLLARKAIIEGSIEKIDIALLVFGLLVVIGVAGESVFGVRAWLINRKLHTLQRDIDQETESIAKTQADTLRLEIAQANARAAEANHKAEAERLARVKIEERLAPRSLSSEQQARIAERLKPFTGQRADILVFGDTPEIAGVVVALTAVTGKAGWNIRMWTVSSSGIFVQGVLVCVKDETIKKDLSAASEFITALHNEGIDVSRQDFPPDSAIGMRFGPTEAADATIRILIGAK